ncbi:hypothetical protein EYF80_017201 [Liparis tanakae]|uniref:Uncharacterized protein n=1 Tax=Liparis tanakae TaxID=230148 RepID=A0A4Z2I5L0_9TELE|nr:hypothetical protein EYF80_017201 [Liparis tanakae]
MFCLIELHTHTSTRANTVDAVPRGAYRILLGQGYSVCFSGKYPTHALNQGDGERDVADLEERILVKQVGEPWVSFNSRGVVPWLDNPSQTAMESPDALCPSVQPNYGPL